jgi:nitroreductase
VKLDLGADELLSTTRAVRRRLDLERPVEREVIEDCLRLALQAPTGSNAQGWSFVVVTDPGRKAALAGWWKAVADDYLAGQPDKGRITAGVRHLAEHLQDVPVLVIPCIAGRTDGQPAAAQAGRWGSIVPAAWSFMLAARERGLGSVWTTFHLRHEREAAELLGIPYDDVMQVALIPVAYTLGTDFRPAPRRPLDAVVHWDGWGRPGA